MDGRWTLGALTLCAAVLLGTGTVSAYEEITVIDGGSVTGSVKFSGMLPPAKQFALWRSPDRMYCGALSDGSGYRLLREVVVSPEGGLKDVVVTIEGIEKGKPFDLKETKLEANVCQFVPFVSVMRDRHQLTVTNVDPVAHDLQIYERDHEHVFIMFHRPALNRTGTAGVIKFTGPRREVTMQCGMHPFMQGHGLAVENPYYAITGADGSFSIADLPAGTYRVRAWHPSLGVKEQQITIVSKGAAVLPFAFDAR